MNITIRPTSSTDHLASEALIRDAFWDLYRPGCLEHLVAHQLRAGSDLLVDLVAEQQSEVVGCLLATRACLIHPDQTQTAMCSLGPIAVASGQQGVGIGSQLIREAVNQLRNAGFPGVFLYGNPQYYDRFGFVDAATWKVTTPDGMNFDAFQGLELIPGGLNDAAGRLLDSADFETQPEQLEAFERRFPARVKHRLPGQLFE